MFEKELTYIKDDKIRKFVSYCVKEMPDYFEHVAASSTGKYHPSYALGEGGLMRHTIAAVKFATELLSIEMFRTKFSDEQRDLIIAALILHDSQKLGSNKKYTVFDHPIRAANFVREKNIECDLLTTDQIKILCNAIESHMGEWNTNPRDLIELPKPTTALQKFVHLCDYLASRRWLEVDFNKI